MRSRLFLATSLAVASLVGGVAIAGQAVQAPAGAKPGHLLADANRDGVTTRQEAIAAADARFSRIDRDGDGRITRAERVARKARPATGADHRPAPGHDRKFGRMDADRDAVVTRDEMRRHATRRFDRVDTNDDGRIDAAERQAIRAKREGRHGRGHGSMHRDHHRGGGHAVDANRDGVATRAEALAAADRRFARIDRDGDGRIVRADLPANAARGAGRFADRMFARLDTDRDGSVTREEVRRLASARFDRVDANRDGRIDAAERATAKSRRPTTPAGAAPRPHTG